MNYKEINFTITPYSEDIADALMAELGTIGYDGFSYTNDGFAAYIPSTAYIEKAVNELELLSILPDSIQIDITVNEIEDCNWNKVWEDSFTPIVVKDRILVRARFHPTIENIEYEIIIEPKMSFGTGHHSTTALMLETILDYEKYIKGKRILDMGCGTGILSIMASKVDARDVTGIDIDEWAYNNAMENVANNHIDNVCIKIGDATLLDHEKGFDVILANINRNILLNDMPHYVKCLHTDGLLIMSGFYETDLPMIQEEAKKQALQYVCHKTENNWVAAVFNKK